MKSAALAVEVTDEVALMGRAHLVGSTVGGLLIAGQPTPSPFLEEPERQAETASRDRKPA